MQTRVTGAVAVMVAAALWLTTGGALLAAAQGSSPVAGYSGPTPTIACQVVNGACTYMISGQINDDANGNGVVDPGEFGASGVTVYLYAGSTATGTPVLSTTSAGGIYTFDGLAPGTYTVFIDQDNLASICSPTTDFDGGTWGTGTVTISQSGDISAHFGCVPVAVQTVDGALAFTGGNQGVLAAVGAAMMAMGAGTFVVRRRIEPVA